VKILVCGSRTYTDAATLRFVLSAWTFGRENVTIIHGAARGADTLADQWATEEAIPVERYPADWKWGKAAGPIRNKQMLAEGRPDLVVAFLDKPLNQSRGTWNMVKLAKAAGVPVHIEKRSMA
jgi:hypothetical protein